MSVPDRSDRRAFELYRHSVEMANLEGKELERQNRCLTNPKWVSRGVDSGKHLDWSTYDYRLAPEAPAVEPWTFETGPEKLKVRSKDDGTLGAAELYPTRYTVFYSHEPDDWKDFTFAEFTQYFEQLNGDPCGTVKASEWPKWFGDGGDHVWQVNQDGSGTYYHQGKESSKIERGGYSDDAALGTLYPQIPQAEAEALIQKARSK